jgi:Flp pilus assembly protein TadD
MASPAWQQINIGAERKRRPIMSPWALWLCMILLIGSGAAADVPFVFDEATSSVIGYTQSQIEQVRVSSPDLIGIPNITPATDNEILKLYNKPVKEFKKVFDDRVDTNNPHVLNTGAILAAKYPGNHTIDQVASVYGYLKNGDDSKSGWSYVSDRRGQDYFRYANESLRLGDETACSGVGDCDDFAILMSALVESIGGTTRIILAQNKTRGGHAYTEVYLGDLSDSNNHVDEIVDCLKQEYNTGKIYTHVTDTKEVWLNLDWGPDEKGNARPGGPFYPGDWHMILCIRDTYKKTPLNIDYANVWKNQGLSLLYQKKYDEAIQAFDSAIEIRPQFAFAWYYKGVALADQGKYDEAIKAYDKAIQRDSNFAWPWHGKGNALNGQGKYDEAIKAYDEAIKLKPNNVAFWNNKCNALMDQRKYDEALQAYGRIIELNPNAVSWNKVGFALIQLGKHDEAIRALDKAIEIDPNDADAWYNKGLAFKSLRQMAKANAAFTKAQKLGYTNYDR